MNLKINFVVFALLLLVADVSAGVLINEVYPNPVTSEYDGEFIELYNPGDEIIDLSNWTIENPANVQVLIPDKMVIQPNGYLLIADGGFKIGKDDAGWPDADIEQEMTLKNTDETIILKNGSMIIDMIGWGNSTAEWTPLKTPKAGKSFERVNFSDTQNNSYDFNEGNPTPTNSTVFNGDGLNVMFSINNVPAVIEKVEILKDDSGSEGIQILPSIKEDAAVPISALISDPNGLNGVSSVFGTFGNQTFNLTLGNTTGTSSNYYGNFSIPQKFMFGVYSVTVFAVDNNGSLTNKTVLIEILPILAVKLNTKILNFGAVNPGTYSNEASIIVENIGNAPVSLGLSSTDLKGSSGYIPAENMFYRSNDIWFNLSKNESFMKEILLASQQQSILFRLFAPVGYAAETYNGKITLTTMAA